MYRSDECLLNQAKMIAESIERKPRMKSFGRSKLVSSAEQMKCQTSRRKRRHEIPEPSQSVIISFAHSAAFCCLGGRLHKSTAAQPMLTAHRSSRGRRRCSVIVPARITWTRPLGQATLGAAPTRTSKQRLTQQRPGAFSNRKPMPRNLTSGPLPRSVARFAAAAHQHVRPRGSKTAADRAHRATLRWRTPTPGA